jgi:hypothetical protein
LLVRFAAVTEVMAVMMAVAAVKEQEQEQEQEQEEQEQEEQGKCQSSRHSRYQCLVALFHQEEDREKEKRKCRSRAAQGTMEASEAWRVGL